jgi:hypothetical protein
MHVPAAWSHYRCDDYFNSDLPQRGWWDASSQFQYIESAEHLVEDRERRFLVIGGPGVDGIQWGYRSGFDGIWAYYPIDDAFVWLAASASGLREGYASGTITV